MQPWIGKRLAHYHIVEKIGAGGMGEVYRATDSKLGREVALKILPSDLAGDAELMGRFEREARILASLNHPGIASSTSRMPAGPTRPRSSIRARATTSTIPSGPWTARGSISLED